jgi:diadenosine tetraphosphate (Ap4A) HIT family hydrolase
MLGYSDYLPACTICSITPEDAWEWTEFVVVAPHSNPLASCHMLIAPRRHVSDFYDLDVQEQRMVWDAVGEMRKRVAASITVEGFDVGFVDAPPNDDGSAHAYVHLIPRISGEHYEKPSGVEWVDLGSER